MELTNYDVSQLFCFGHDRHSDVAPMSIMNIIIWYQNIKIIVDFHFETIASQQNFKRLRHYF
jgi:hypothetical protein